MSKGRKESEPDIWFVEDIDYNERTSEAPLYSTVYSQSLL